MDRTALLNKIVWRLQQPWHFRHQPDTADLSVHETLQGLQTLLLAEQGTMLAQTLALAGRRPVAFEELERLEITLYQEGVDQRVWRARATLTDRTTLTFGIIVARAPGASSDLTQRDCTNLRQLQQLQPLYCVAPYVCGLLPAGVAAFTVEWLDLYKELVFEISLDAGVFLVNTPGTHRHFSPQMSRRLWRRMVEVLWCYPGLQRVNIQAGDFVGRVLANGAGIDLKLTTARELQADPGPTAHIHAMLGCVITASGYLSDGRQPFDRHMSAEVFVRRMHAVLRRRFGDQAHGLAQRQWGLFQQGRFARQEDWLKEDCIMATHDHLRADRAVEPAWRATCQRWMAYAEAVQAGTLPPSWWFPVADIPVVLAQLAARHDFR